MQGRQPPSSWSTIVYLQIALTFLAFVIIIGLWCTSKFNVPIPFGSTWVTALGVATALLILATILYPMAPHAVARVPQSLPSTVRKGSA